jgi:small subunit ribosomal protein S6
VCFSHSDLKYTTNQNLEYLPVSVAETETVKQNLYEGMFLVDSAQFANDPEATAAAIMAILERAGATVVAHRPWQDGKLAYEIEGRRKGLHYVVCFRMPGDGVNVVTRQSQLSEIVLRQIVIRHTPELFNAMVDVLNGVAEATAAIPDGIALGPDGGSF